MVIIGQEDFLFDISSFFPSRGRASFEPANRGALIFFLVVTIMFGLLGAAIAFGPMRRFADEESSRAGYMVLALSVVGVLVLCRRLARR